MGLIDPPKRHTGPWTVDCHWRASHTRRCACSGTRDRCDWIASADGMYCRCDVMKREVSKEKSSYWIPLELRHPGTPPPQLQIDLGCAACQTNPSTSRRELLVLDWTFFHDPCETISWLIRLPRPACRCAAVCPPAQPPSSRECPSPLAFPTGSAGTRPCLIPSLRRATPSDPLPMIYFCPVSLEAKIPSRRRSHIGTRRHWVWPCCQLSLVSSFMMEVPL